jgi:hypothetical protein
MSLNPSQHTTRGNGADSQLVMITAPHHPLCGQVLPVVRRLHKQGEPQFVVRLPSAATQLIPARWTASSPPGSTPAADVLPGSVWWSLPSVRALVRIVGALRDHSSPQQEVGDAAVNCSHASLPLTLPALGDLPAAGAPCPGESVDRSARPPGAGPASRSGAGRRRGSAEPTQHQARRTR